MEHEETLEPIYEVSNQRFLVLLIFSSMISMTLIVQGSWIFTVPETQNLFGLTSPHLINMANIVFQFMSFPGILISFYCRSKISLRGIVILNSLLFIIGAVLRQWSYPFKMDFSVLVVGNCFIGLARTILFSYIGFVSNKWFADDERSIS